MVHFQIHTSGHLKGGVIMGILSNRDIVRRINSRELVIEPFDIKRVNEDSVDLCLSSRLFTFGEVWRIECVDLVQQLSGGFLSGELGLCTQAITKPAFVLRPGQVVRGYVQEYIQIPQDITAFVDGKSTWAQLGLQVASAGQVHATWKGNLVLELVNLGNLPLKLSEGLPICQISFHTLSSPVLPQDELLALWKGEG